MDAITEIALSIDNPMLGWIGMLIQNPVAYAIMIFALIIGGEGRHRKQKKILFSLLLSFALVAGIKYAMAVERPCFGEDWCPDSYSFPSLHAAIAFTLMTSFLNKKSYPYYLLFALFVGFTRLNIGVHTFYDVAGALPLALFSYYVIAVAYERWSKDG
jgi:membrane-associated phospholipid phosphatase